MMRRGRGGTSEEVRQLGDETSENIDRVRRAVLEVPPRKAVFSGGYDAGSNGAERFAPFASGGSATTATALHTVSRPFARCRITKFAAVSETDPSVLRLRVYRYPSTQLYDSGLLDAAAGEEVSCSPDLEWPDGALLAFSVGPGAAVDEVGVTVHVEEERQ